MINTEVDNHKLMYHPERVAEWHKNEDCFPIYVEIGATNRCNHRCMFCALDWLEKGGVNIDTDVLSRNLEDMALHGVKSIMYAGEGEPLLHKDIGLFVKKTKELGIDVSMTSNGIPFIKEKAEELLPYFSWLRFSVDAGTAKTYSELHGTNEKDFERIMKNIGDATEIKRKNNYQATIGVQALLTNKSLNELVNLAKTIKELGADNIQIKPYSHHPASRNDLRFNYFDAENIRPELIALSDDKFQVIYRTQTINRLCGERDYKECHGLPFFTLIDAHANVLPCNLFYNNPEFTYGNLNEKKFSEIWKSEKRQEVINKITEKGIEDCRLGCRLDVINRYLGRLKDPHPHDNFI
ncbi:MAG: radical SAM protein [Nanoarchaeota archaeon]|nr:radical SAM protein [Nanoarchaeota archaeon]